MSTRAAAYVVDSSVVIALLRPDRHPHVDAAFTEALLANARFLLCPVVYYEVRRGLESRRASAQLSRFREWVANLEWHDLELDDWEEAAVLYAQLKQTGRSVDDADILIAVYARRRGATVVTHNVRHFAGLGVEVADWEGSR